MRQKKTKRTTFFSPIFLVLVGLVILTGVIAFIFAKLQEQQKVAPVNSLYGKCYVGSCEQCVNGCLNSWHGCDKTFGPSRIQCDREYARCKSGCYDKQAANPKDRCKADCAVQNEKCFSDCFAGNDSTDPEIIGYCDGQCGDNSSCLAGCPN